MDHVLAMAELDSLQQLVDKVAHLVQLDAVWVLFKQLEQVLLDVFEHQVQTIASTTQSKSKLPSFRQF